MQIYANQSVYAKLRIGIPLLCIQLPQCVTLMAAAFMRPRIRICIFFDRVLHKSQAAVASASVFKEHALQRICGFDNFRLGFRRCACGRHCLHTYVDSRHSAQRLSHRDGAFFQQEVCSVYSRNLCTFGNLVPLSAAQYRLSRGNHGLMKPDDVRTHNFINYFRYLWYETLSDKA